MGGGGLLVINVELEVLELGVLDEVDEVAPARILEQIAWHHDGLVSDQRNGELVILDDSGVVLERMSLLVHSQDLDIPVEDWHAVVHWNERQAVELDVPGRVQVGQTVASELLGWRLAVHSDVLVHLHGRLQKASG